MPLSRRQFLVAALAPARPNILLLLADNWAYPHASAYRGGVPTPTFDRIAAQGALFHHAFAPNPSCSPSRSGLLTGQWTHALGPAASLYGPLAPGQPTYPQLLAQAGYHVGHSGKGWGPGPGKPAGNPAGPAYPSFTAFLEAKPAKQPFCFWFGSHDPHVPWTPPANAQPTQLPLPAHLPDAPPVRLELNAYAGEVQRFDNECAELLTLLTQRNELQNTLIVMSSDNGWQMPRGLANCYDLGVRIPLAIRYPAHFKSATQRHDFVSLYDLAPTFLAAAGLPLPHPMRHTQSLFSSTKRTRMFLERERHANVREGNLSYPVRGVRTADYLYLHNLEPDRWPAGDPTYYWAVGEYGDVDESLTKRYILAEKLEPAFSLAFSKRPAEELYHLPSDPGQIMNVAAQPLHQKSLKRLRAEVESWRQATTDPARPGPWDSFPYTGPRRRQPPPV